MELFDPVVIALKAELDNPSDFGDDAFGAVDPIFHNEEGVRLIRAFLAVKTPKEIALLLKDLLTDRQIDSCKRRLFRGIHAQRRRGVQIPGRISRHTFQDFCSSIKKAEKS